MSYLTFARGCLTIHNLQCVKIFHRHMTFTLVTYTEVEENSKIYTHAYQLVNFQWGLGALMMHTSR